MSGPKRRFTPTKEELESLYQRFTLKKIGEMFDIGETAVFNRVKEYGIKLHGVDNPRTRPKVFTPEHIAALRKSAKERRGKYVGENNHNWKGGLSDINMQARRSGAYKEWKRASLERAQFRCEDCGVLHKTVCECCGTKVILHVHHLHSFAKHPEKRFDLSNSEVLCPKCHYSRHKRKPGEFGGTL